MNCGRIPGGYLDDILRMLGVKLNDEKTCVVIRGVCLKLDHFQTEIQFTIVVYPIVVLAVIVALVVYPFIVLPSKKYHPAHVLP